MPPPGLSIGVGSDDEDNEVDVSDAGAPPSLALNTTMAGVLPAGLALGPILMTKVKRAIQIKRHQHRTPTQ